MSFFGNILKSAAVAAALITAPLAANAITVTSSGLVENATVAFSVGDIFTADIDGDAVDGGGSATFGVTPTSNLLAIETNSLNPVTGFLMPSVVVSTAMNGGGTVLGTISGASLIAGDALVVALAAGVDHWITASWTNVSQDGSNFYLRVVAAVPVPAAGVLLVGALGGLALMRRRKTA